jgi:hypothetical protein
MPVWIDGKTARGYKAEQFADAFHRVLGVRSVRDVRSGFPSHAAPNAPNAPNALPTGDGPLSGDPMYPVMLAEAANKGHITEDEFRGLYEHHKLLERAREAQAA